MTDTYVNFLGGSPLNRLSWLRTSQPFLNSIIHASATRWIVFREGQPLLVSEPSPRSLSLARLSTSDVRPFLGSEPFFAQGENDGEHAPSDATTLEAARLRGPPIVFLGLHETQTSTADALPSSDFSGKTDPQSIIKNIHGTPYFSLDVSDVEQDKVDSVLQNSEAGKKGAQLLFEEPRKAMGNFDAFEAAIFAEARSLVDWNGRNKFCAGCGSPVYSLWAGWKLSCASLLPWADNTGRKPCPTAKGLHNYTHPRTDAVVIMAIVDESGEKVLLGRNRKWPGNFYSALAGFVEPGESFEDAVKREIWEEAGVTVWDVQYHSTQPWPYPANLMVGFYATASSTKPIRTDLDNELEDARWYTREEVLEVLSHADGTTLTARDHKQIEAAQQLQASTANALAGDAAQNDEVAKPVSRVSFRVPPVTAIAGVLISEWAHRRAGPGSNATLSKKGNL